MTARRFTTDPPLASADTWAGRTEPTRLNPYKENTPRWDAWNKGSEAIFSGNIARRAEVTPLAEHLVLDCLRALKVIAPSPYALGLIDMISRGFLETPEHMVRMRRIDALLEISAEESAS